MEYEVQGYRQRGRSNRTWREVVEKDCQARKLNKENATDCSRWRKLIKDARWSWWMWVGECFFWYLGSPGSKGHLCVFSCACTFIIYLHYVVYYYSDISMCNRDITHYPASGRGRRQNYKNYKWCYFCIHCTGVVRPFKHGYFCFKVNWIL